MNKHMDRRGLLRLLAGLGAAVVVDQRLAFGASATCSGVFGELDEAAIAELGREYLSQRSDAAAVDAIAKLLAESQDEAKTLEQLRARVLADFTAGRIVNLAGWFVSETEGCVFAALSRCASEV
ncbi:hypothetical protein JM946_01525 [Steroidobacter sp. S1-65]|uniref:Twin-arginine translocation signal domain-containing protein n=1 Tax=Steroidobacter gossypii TaxID=2805490 RepID=A0ABS1WR08_9GAMM|nr:hypothetical protein [Steroidobacter gossypii]MBM0103400.1 hypothetical protein [Steroidobacter gossypii]